MAAPRTILYTGKGGVGKTSVAACTALSCARAGRRTLILSTDPAHSLAESLQAEVGDAPTEVAPRLWAQQIDAQAEIERNWSAVREWLGGLLMDRGVDRISAEELTVPPGVDELFALLVLRSHHRSEDWEVIVVDCAPTGETLRLLAFPDVARWWLEKVFPWEKQIVAAARPIARSLLDIPMPGEAAFADVHELVRNLVAMSDILRDRERASVRLVMNPDAMVIGEAMRTFTYLNLYGYLTDAVVVNRVFPAEVGAYFERWRERQGEHLERVESAFAPVPVLRAPYFEQEVAGDAMLQRLAAAVFDGQPPDAVLHAALTRELTVEEDRAVLRLDLPLASKGEIALRKIGAELVVRVGEHKRIITLPGALAAFIPAGATFDDDRTLAVTLQPES